MKRLINNPVALAVVLGFVLGVPLGWKAWADTARGTCSNSLALITHGDFARLPDAGWAFTVCGETKLIDAGVDPIGTKCILCAPGAFSNATSTCRTNWQNAHCP